MVPLVALFHWLMKTYLVAAGPAASVLAATTDVFCAWPRTGSDALGRPVPSDVKLCQKDASTHPIQVGRILECKALKASGNQQLHRFRHIACKQHIRLLTPPHLRDLRETEFPERASEKGFDQIDWTPRELALSLLRWWTRIQAIADPIASSMEKRNASMIQQLHGQCCQCFPFLPE